MSITNTSKDEINPGWLMGGDPHSIYAQEARGQQELAKSSQLPIQGFAVIKDHLEKLGVKVIGPSKNDELFYDVELPSGWEIKPTDHSMHNELVDDKGKMIASIFYKAAFYDRKASIYLAIEQ